MQMGVAINERLTSAQILKSWESTKKKVDPTYLLEEYHQAFRKALRKKQSEEWDKLMNRDIVGMRVRDKYTDFKLALFTMHNDDISDEEAERRLETLPEGAIDSANVWIREFQLPRVEWEIEEFLDDLPIEVWSEWQDRFQEAREALEELLKKHLEQVRLRTQEWFVETKKKWGELLHEATQVDMSFESRFGRLTELKIIAGKT
jgi:hypothetical protein